MARTRHEDIVDQLDQFYAQAKRQILQNQSAITGLFPANSADKSSASIKASLWATSSIFALYLAYSKRIDNDQGKAHDLGQSVVKCMRGILFAWMRQSEKVEQFKANQSPKHALHLKFDLNSGLASDNEYPHLQIDVVSLYLIFLAEFIASGLDIIYCMDEVTFIQNLVYYVERAYRTPDYGNWEPILTSDHRCPNSSSSQHSQNPPTQSSSYQNQPKSYNEPINYHLNQSGQTASAIEAGAPSNRYPDERSLEIHATSIGMAKSALEAINGCNLFGGKGANWSIIYSDVDAHSRNRSIFETLLPRESRSKNTDSYLLATISWPCFATHDPTLYQSTKGKILRKLKGKYGLKRFLRDSYGTVLDVSSSQANEASSKLDLSQTSSRESPTPCIHQQQQRQNISNNMSISSQHSSGYIRESSFSSTCSSISLGEPPKTKQRKSSYWLRKNPARETTHTHTRDESSDSYLQRTDSTLTKMSKRYENIESEWPLFICFLIIDGIFKQDMDQIYENEKLLYERLLKVDPKSCDYLMPKYYYVPKELIYNEKCCPESVERLPSAEGSSEEQIFVIGQSILLITRLLLAGLVHPNELDPLRRHMPSHDRPKKIGRYSSFQATSTDLVVQTVLIAESIRLQAMMANYGIQTQTPLEVEPVQIWSSAQLVKVYEYLGVNEKLGLKGRPSRPIGALGTSKLYRICGQTILCYPLIFEVSDFYLAQDMLLLIDDIQNELNFIGRYWRMSGRPTVCILIREEHFRDVHFRDLLDLLVQFKNGKLKKSGLRIKTGRLQNLISSSCIEHLDFLHLLPHEHLPQFKSFKQLVESPKQFLFLSSSSRRASFSSHSRSHHHQPIAGSSSFGRHRKRSNLGSASSGNLQAIEEMNSSLSQDQSPSESLAVDQDAGYRDELDCNLTKSKGFKSVGSYSELESYVTLPCNSIDYYECYKDAPTWPTLIELLRSNNELSAQSQLLSILLEREGPKYCIDDLSVEDRLEQVSQSACQSRHWSVVRYCSAILKRSVESLSPWLTSILVNNKQISLGTGSNERIINNPLTPTEIHTLIYSTINTKNPCDVVLQQEIALYIGRLISTRPDYFDGILTIRVTNFMSAMRSYLAIKTNELKSLREKQSMASSSADADKSTEVEESNNDIQQTLLDLRIKTNIPVELPRQPAHESGFTSFPSGSSMPQIKVEVQSQTHEQRAHKGVGKYRGSRIHSNQNFVARPLESLSPSDVRKLLIKVLNNDDSLPISDRRQITGELCRVPKDFYAKVWSLLSCTNLGIVIGGKMLRSTTILTTMTQDDLNFALRVESSLSSIDCPKLRQINVELLMALHVILERNPEIRFESDPLDLDRIINLSLEKFRSDFARDDYGLREYYNCPAQTTMLYTIRTVFDCLLPVKYKSREECKLN